MGALCSKVGSAITGAGILIVDPIPLAKEPLELLENEIAPTAIVLTNANYERAAVEYKKRFAIPIYAHIEARRDVNAERQNDR